MTLGQEKPDVSCLSIRQRRTSFPQLAAFQCLCRYPDALRRGSSFGYCVKEDSTVYGFKEVDFDPDPDSDFDFEETKF